MPWRHSRLAGLSGSPLLNLNGGHRFYKYVGNRILFRRFKKWQNIQNKNAVVSATARRLVRRTVAKFKRWVSLLEIGRIWHVVP